MFIGTLYPLALEVLTGEKISVGAPFFNFTFLPLIVPLLLLLPLGQTLAWKRGDFLGTAQRLYAVFGLALAGDPRDARVDRMAGPSRRRSASVSALYLVLGSLNEIVTRSWSQRHAARRSRWRKARGLPRSAWGTAIAHAGVGLTVIGIAATAWSVESHRQR